MPRKRQPPRPDPLVIEIMAALGAGRVHAASLRDEDDPDLCVVHGYCERSNGRVTITINEAADLIDTILHEALHAVRPQWTERGVKARVTRMLRTLTQDECERIYDVYTAIRQRRPRKVV